tara:strand:- start:2604 stop:3068 length:465 start_codon:yes stop_codon:yes gene_type:complete
MKVRYATRDDINEGVALGKKMWAESEYKEVEWDTEKTRLFVANLMDADNSFSAVAVDDEDKIMGFYLGYLTDFFFSHGKVACDYVWFVDPSKRGGIAGIKLFKFFEKWAKDNGASEIRPMISTGVMIDKTKTLLEHLGYNHVGYTFVKQIEKEN